MVPLDCAAQLGLEASVASAPAHACPGRTTRSRRGPPPSRDTSRCPHREAGHRRTSICGLPTTMPMLAAPKQLCLPIRKGSASAFCSRSAMRTHRLCVSMFSREHAELVAAEPREHVAWTQLRLQPCARSPSGIGRRRRGRAVVDQLEAVEVDEQDRIAGRWRAARLRDRALNQLAEERAVREIRQRIVLCLPAPASRGCAAVR